jgi:uncharacterized protein (DUF924 family)
LDLGVVGDVRGTKPGRQVTVLFREGWEKACRDLGVSLPWTTRRANLLVEDLPVPREGAHLVLGELLLEVTGETKPCQVMEAACPGLRRALTPEWRGGVTCRVLKGGTIRVGDHVEVSMSMAAPRDILDFWFREIRSERWFASDPALDAAIRGRFEETWRAAHAGGLGDWTQTKEGTLALILVLDQFPRNMFRGSADAYATDGQAREVAKYAIARGFDLEFPPAARNFVYLPLSHSEDLADQEASVRLTQERLGEGHSSYPYALRHRDAIARFGRFPKRNAALGRQSTPAEIEFLAKNPLGF